MEMDLKYFMESMKEQEKSYLVEKLFVFSRMQRRIEERWYSLLSERNYRKELITEEEQRHEKVTAMIDAIQRQIKILEHREELERRQRVVREKYG